MRINYVTGMQEESGAVEIANQNVWRVNNFLCFDHDSHWVVIEVQSS